VNGTGWVCDECGHTKVVAGAPIGLFGGGPPPPSGWFVLTKTIAVGRGRWELCSIECVHAVAGRAVKLDATEEPAE
jgi:hypothetical protein